MRLGQPAFGIAAGFQCREAVAAVLGADRDRQSERNVGRSENDVSRTTEAARAARFQVDDRGGSRDGERLEPGEAGDRDQLDNDAVNATASTYFDANGNNIAYGDTYTYDWANRLLTKASSSVTITYDADGNLLSEEHDDRAPRFGIHPP